MVNPSRMITPNKMTTELPTAKVIDCNRADSRLCANPLIEARKVCQESDAKKAPMMKAQTSINDWLTVTRNPNISDVKYVTVTGFNSVSPRTIPYALEQLIDSFCLRNPGRAALIPRYSNQIPIPIKANALTVRITAENGAKISAR